MSEVQAEAVRVISLAIGNARDTLRAAGVSVDGLLLVIAVPVPGPLVIAGAGCSKCMARLIDEGPRAVADWSERMHNNPGTISFTAIAPPKREFDA